VPVEDAFILAEGAAAAAGRGVFNCVVVVEEGADVKLAIILVDGSTSVTLLVGKLNAVVGDNTSRT
jgi:hypothetical protein